MSRVLASMGDVGAREGGCVLIKRITVLVAVALVMAVMMAITPTNGFAEELPPPDQGCSERIVNEGIVTAQAVQQEQGLPDAASGRSHMVPFCV
jgi:hypothetical protein